MRKKVALGGVIGEAYLERAYTHMEQDETPTDPVVAEIYEEMKEPEPSDRTLHSMNPIREALNQGVISEVYF